MPNHLSIIGIIHTIVSVIAVFFAFYSLARYGKIAPDNRSGKWYIGLTLFACFSSFLVMKTGHFSSAHLLTVMVLVILPFAVYAKKIRLFGRKAAYFETVLMSTTLFFSLIPAIVETLTRVPISQPIASSDQSPIIKMALFILISFYTIGIIYQIWKIHSLRHAEGTYGKLHV